MSSVKGQKYRKGFYPFPKFLEVCRQYGFSGQEDYLARYKQYEGLPSTPHKAYKDEWKNAGGWGCLNGNLQRDFYSFSDFLDAVRRHGFTSQDDYNFRYKTTDTRLPAVPRHFYEEEWKKIGGWSGLVVKIARQHKRSSDLYTFQEFLEVWVRYKFQNSTDYRGRFKEDPRLPASPHQQYKEEWKKFGGWSALPGYKTIRLNSLPKDLHGLRLKTEEGVIFSVGTGKYFSMEETGTSVRPYLSGLSEGKISLISFSGKLVLAVRVCGGVFCLTSIVAQGKELFSPIAISGFLQINNIKEAIEVRPL